MVHTINPTPAPSQTQLIPYRAIARDPEMYPDPEEFKPERWLDPQYPTYKGPLTAYPTLIKCVHVHRSFVPLKRSHPLTFVKATTNSATAAASAKAWSSSTPN
jgi:hypothetical protein